MKTVKDYITYLEQSKYTQKTILNRILSLERLCGLLDEKFDLIFNGQISNRKGSTQTRTAIKTTFEWVKAQAKMTSPLANKETKMRNSREALEADSRWISVSKLFEKEMELKPTIDALLDDITANSKR